MQHVSVKNFESRKAVISTLVVVICLRGYQSDISFGYSLKSDESFLEIDMKFTRKGRQSGNTSLCETVGVNYGILLNVKEHNNV